MVIVIIKIPGTEISVREIPINNDIIKKIIGSNVTIYPKTHLDLGDDIIIYVNQDGLMVNKSINILGNIAVHGTIMIVKTDYHQNIISLTEEDILRISKIINYES